MKRVPVTVWTGCYEKQWSGVLIPDAFKHPAKFSRGLVERLLDYGVEKGYWSKGDRLGDPFGGIGGGAIPAADRGFEWIGSELEQQFVEIGNRNLEAHSHKWRTMGLPRPTLVQGDSRNFASVMRSAAGIVTSPPFLDARSGTTTRSTSTKKGGDCATRHHTTQAGAGYGESEEQIGNLPPGELDGAVTSPPYAGTAVSKHSPSIDIEKNWETYRSSGGGMSFEAYRDYQASLSIEYGNNEAQIGNLRETQLDAAVTSPPFGTREDGGGIAQTGDTSRSRGGKRISRGAIAAVVTSPPYAAIAAGAGGLNHLPPKQEGQQSGRAHAGSQDTDQRYGDDAGQIAKLGAGDVEAVITSPPYADSLNSEQSGIDWKKSGRPERDAPSGSRHGVQGASMHKMSYGDDPANIGKLGGGETCYGCGKRLQTVQWQNVKIVELESIAEAGGVSSTTVTISDGQGEKKARHTKPRSQRRISECRANATARRIQTGTEDQTAGEGTRGKSAAESHSAAMGTNAAGAQAITTLSSTTKKTCTKLEENGITVSTILRRFAEAVTRVSTPDDPQSVGIQLCARCAEKLTSRKSNVMGAVVTEIAARLSTQLNTTAGKIGRVAGETYWVAMKKCYSSMFDALRPGGYAAIVVKDYVRDWKRVPLCDDTMRLLEHVGFEPIERIHAMVTEETRHGDLFQGEIVKVKSRKSFFRRLQEKRGAPKIDHEEILIVKKPLLSAPAL